MLQDNSPESLQETLSWLKVGNTTLLSERVDRMRMYKITHTKDMHGHDRQNADFAIPDSTLLQKGNTGNNAYHDTAWSSFSTDISNTDQYHSGIIFS